jgi:hypothetical protein
MAATKTRLTDESFKDLLFKELNSGNTQAHLKTNFYTLLQTNWSLDKTRSLKLHDSYYPLWTQLQDKATNEQSIANTIALVKSTNITKESLLLELEEVKELAKVPDNAGRINTQAVIKAIEVQAKMLGLNEAQKQELIINKGFYLELDKDGE